MTRQPHDQFAKQYLKELLEPLGTVEISREIPGETLQIDLFFQPAPEPPSNPPALGLLRQLAATPSLWEPFRNCPTNPEIRNCILKLFYVHGELQRQAKRQKQTLQDSELPQLWILTPTLSERVMEFCGARSNLEQWCSGVYLLPGLIKTGIIAINQLPETPETLWLRLLGKGGTQKRAIQEVVELPPDHPQQRNILELIGIWQINVETRIDLNPEDRELIMELSPAYIKWREDTIQLGLERGIEQGIEQGIQQGLEQLRQTQRLMMETLLRNRFGSLDEELTAIVDRLLELSPEEAVSVSMQNSREELLARFSEQGDGE